MKSVRKAYSRALWKLLLRRVRIMKPEELRQSAVVFAPHPDDETLGCGGLIFQKTRAGARVSVVFMTDGTRSHSAFMSKTELAKRRMHEASAALEVLGVCPADTYFLNARDGELHQHREEAGNQVSALLNELKPDQVYLPFREEPTSDHLATNQIVTAALSEQNSSPAVLEYPIWFWHHWPWVRVPIDMGPKNRKLIRTSLRFRFGLRLLTDFQVALPLGTAGDAKRQALEQHQSQMRALVPGVGWPVLQDVSHGDFLDCFFNGWEVFSE